MPPASPDLLPEAFPPITLMARTAAALAGLVCAGLILGALVLSRVSPEPEPEPETYVARQVTLPFDEPPPPSEQAPVDYASVASPIRLEIAAAASAVHIQIPDLPLPLGDRAPPAARAMVAARFDLARSATRPARDNGDPGARHIFSRPEVDQRPMVLQRVKPRVSFMKVRNMATPRTTMLLVVNIDGTVGDVRLLHGSQDDDFDRIIMDTIREWRFSPAVRKGRKVRCWVEQAVTVKVAQGSAFEVY